MPASELHKLATNPIFVGAAQRLNKMSGGNAFEPCKIDVYPDVLEYGWNYLLGGFGRFAGNTTGFALDKAAGVETPVHRIPFVRRFVGQDLKSEFLASEKFYEAMKGAVEESSRYRRAVREQKEAGPRSGEAQNVIDRLGPKVGPRTGQRGGVSLDVETVFREAQKELARLRVQEKEIRGSNIPRAESAALLQALRKQQAEIMNSARLLYRQINPASLQQSQY